MNLVMSFFIMLCVASMCAIAEGQMLTPEPSRITDETISSDINSINRLQKRLADVNSQGTPIGSYHFAKAQAWIDMAMDEYTMNDRTMVIEDALRQASDLISQLEEKKQSISMTTVILPTSKKIRPDLWQKVVDWKKHPGFSCGEDLVAQLEVQLVWAGHEDNQLGWRHAKPYLQAAERLAREAKLKIESCQASAPPVSGTNPAVTLVDGDADKNACRDALKACPACPVCPEPSEGVNVAQNTNVAGAESKTVSGEKRAAVSQPSSASAPDTIVPDRVHFALNRDLLSSRSAAVLQRVVAIMRANPEIKVELRGHSDERGRAKFNEILSRQRAEVVRTYLVAAGIRRSRISVKALGEASPFMCGSDIVSYARNRRVEFSFTPPLSVMPVPQFEDVQIERK